MGKTAPTVRIGILGALLKHSLLAVMESIGRQKGLAYKQANIFCRVGGQGIFGQD